MPSDLTKNQYSVSYGPKPLGAMPPPQTAKPPSRLRGQKTTIQNRECLVTKNHFSKKEFQKELLDNTCIFWGFPKYQFGVNWSIIRVPNRRKPSFFTLFLVFAEKRRYFSKKILAHANFVFFKPFFRLS